MLEKLRDASKGWFAAVLILLLVGSFGLWGVADMFNLTEQPKIATVAGEDISPEQFQQEFSRFLGQMSRSTGSEVTSQQAKLAGLDRVALERFIKKLSLLNLANDLDMKISPAQIVEALKPIPGLVDSKGKLIPGAITQLARANSISETQFIELITGDLLREQLLRSVAGGVGMPVGLENALNQFRLERRVTEYLIIDPSRAGAIGEPDDASLKKFYDENAVEKYSTPEIRDVVVIVLKPDLVSSKVVVTDADIAKAYDLNRGLYEVLEKRSIEQIRFKTEAEAVAAKSKLDSGAKFEDIAKQQGFNADDIKLGEVSKGDKSVPASAFDLPLMTASAPSKNSFGGWVIVRALSSTPGSVKTLEEVKEEIRQKLTEPRIKDELFELTNDLEDALGKGATLEEAAAQLKIPVLKVSLSRTGDDASGNPVEGLPGGMFVQQVFAADTGTEPELLQTDDGVYYEFRVDKITKSSKKSLDSVKATVIADWKDSELSRKLEAISKDVLKRAKGGENFQSVATSLGLSLVKSDPMPRYGRSVMFGEATVSAASDAKIGEYFSGPVSVGKGIVVGRVSEILFADEPLDSPARSAYLQRLTQSFVSDFVEQFETGAAAKANAKIDEARFQAFHNNE